MKRHINIPVFISHMGCPFNCSFCNQKEITESFGGTSAAQVEKTIEEALKTIDQKSDVEIAFFGGSFTGIDEPRQREFLSLAREYIKNGKASGIRISTRPDYIDDSILKMLKEYGVRAIELGAQSTDDEVLDACDRGHSREHIAKASALILKYGFELGLQMMVGLPKSNRQKEIQTALDFVSFAPKTVRIYPTLVVAGTKLQEDYLCGKYIPLKLSEAVEITKELMLVFEKECIDVIRVGLMSNDGFDSKTSLIAGPYHPAFKELCEAQIMKDAAEKILSLGNYCGNDIVITVCDKSISKMAGQKRDNIECIKKKYGLGKIKIAANADFKKYQIEINKST